MPRRPRETTSSNTYRFFVDPAAFEGERFTSGDPELARQIGGVLRLGPGDRIVALDGEGWEHVVALERVDRRGAVTGRIERRTAAAGEPRAQLTLYLPLIRPERFEWALQKGTELGATAFVPTICAHSFSEGGPAAGKLLRWRKILREAAEQSRRGRLPRLESPIPFADACARAGAAGHALLLWEGQGAAGLREVLRRLTDRGRPMEHGAPDAAGHDAPAPGLRAWSILSGPEGGLSEEERRLADRHGIIPVSLGPRTLRAETAPIAAAAAVLYEVGDLE